MTFPNSPNSVPRCWAWIATALTLIAFILLRTLCAHCVPEESGDVWHTATKISEEGITQIGTFSLVMLTLLADSWVPSAWVALVGLALWLVGLISVAIYGPTPLAAVVMMVGSALILLAHLHHFSRLLFRRWMRILRDGNLKRILVLLVLLIFGASIGLMNIRSMDEGAGFNTHAAYSRT